MDEEAVYKTKQYIKMWSTLCESLRAPALGCSRICNSIQKLLPLRVSRKDKKAAGGVFLAVVCFYLTT